MRNLRRFRRSVVSPFFATFTSKRTRLQVRQQLSRLRGRQAVHIFHIGKTGGTAVRNALQWHRHPGRFNIHLQFHDTRLRDLPRGDLVVFFLRDPVARFASSFDNQLRQGAPLYTHEWTEAEAAAFGRFETDGALALALGSGDGETRRAAEAAMQSIEHVNTSYWDWFEDETYFRSRLDDILFVGFQETLGADFDELKRRLGVASDVGLPVDDRHAQRRPSKPEPLPLEAVALLRNWYAVDYEFIRLCEKMALCGPAPFDVDSTELAREG